MKASKLLVLLVLISNLAFANIFDLSSPQSTMKTFLKNMVAIKNKTGDINQAYSNAIKTLDLSDFETQTHKTVGRQFAQDLIYTLDRLEKINYADIPDSGDGTSWVFDKRRAQGKAVTISIVKIENDWKFSKDTISSLATYKSELEKKKVVAGVTKLTTWKETLRSKMPKTLRSKNLGLESWQWLGILGLIVISLIFEKLAAMLATFIVNKNFKIFQIASSDHLNKAIVPFRRLLFTLLLIPGLEALDLPAQFLKYGHRLLFIIASICLVWLAHRIVEMISYYFAEAAKNTNSKFDDIIIPLATKTSFVLVYIIGTILVAHNFGINVTGMVAGLGIGGLAFAFAAKDTLANFFGSIMLVLDRPFDIGDYITTSDFEGIVVEVGFRSTRIRTFYDSIITISNGELVNKAIDNKGKRRYRRLNTTLGLEYDTPPEKIEEFCEGIRQLILNHRWTRKDNFNVYFVNYGASSLDIQLMVFWQTEDYAREQVEKHRLMIDILRLAKEVGVNFAFPTQTVHLFNEQEKPNFNVNESYLDDGINKAKKVAQKPFTLKNPRSNANDEEQFGKNDIGT